MTQTDPVTAIRKEQEFYGKKMAQGEQRNGGQKRYDFKKQDRNKPQKPAGRKYEGHEAELHEAIKSGATVVLHNMSNSTAIEGVILDMDKFAVKLRLKDTQEGITDFWFYKHAFDAVAVKV